MSLCGGEQDGRKPEMDVEAPSIDTERKNGRRRLIISKMVLENFKSYGNRVEIGPFHHCFSSVVGPNGSGKSNVIDAMLFVFGKRAKQLRLNKIRELIHKSDNFAPTSATVTVYMQEIEDLPTTENDSGMQVDGEEGTPPPRLEAGRNLPYRVIPNTEVELSRTAKSDNSSIYKLNGKNTQFKDIATFLKTKGIDLEHNRFLILQGEVELISMMPPKGKNEGDNDGLLEYLEDIIGSHTFVPATMEAAAQVEALTVARQEKLNRVKAAEQETKALEAAKNEAHALLRRERDIRQKQNILYQVERLQMQRNAASLHEKRSDLEEQLQACRKDAKEAFKELNEMKKKHKEILCEHEKVHEELKRTEQEWTEYERRDIKLRETIKHTKNKIKDLQKKVEEHDKKEKEAQEKYDSAVKRVPELEQEIEDLKAKKAKEDEALEILQADSHEKTQRLRSELEFQTQALAPLLQERASCKAALETAETEINLVQDATKEAQVRLEEATKELDSLDATKLSKQAEMERQQSALEEAISQVHSLEQEDHSLAEREALMSQRSKSLMARAEEAKAALQSKGGYKSSPAVQGILKAASPGGPLAKMGILGRLGDLATIDAKYDVAVSTACSGYLDHIVVQTTAGAQRCLEFLRQYNLGRANFIPLDKMKKGAHDRVVETPEQAPRLLELIQPVPNHNHASVMSALLLAVSDTLVAPDLETATRWAYDYNKRWRVVTLDGKLLETAGTMSGGGRHVSKGGMRLRNTRATSLARTEEDEDDGLDMDVKKLEEESEKTHSELQQIRQRRKEISDQLRQLKRNIKDFERSLPKLKMDIDSFDTTRWNLTQLIPQLQQQSKMSSHDEEKVKELSKKVSQCRADMKECVARASELEKEVSRLQKSILDAGGPAVKKQQGKCDKLLQQIKTAEKDLSSSKVLIKSSDKAMKKARDAKSQAEKQEEEAHSLLEKTQTEFKSLEENAHAVKNAYETVKEAAAAATAELEKIEAAAEKMKEAHASFKGKEVELLGHVDALIKSIADHEQKLCFWDSAIEKLLRIAKKDEQELWDEEDECDDTGEVPESSQTTNSGLRETCVNDIEMEDNETNGGGPVGDDDVEMIDENSSEKEKKKEKRELNKEDQRLAASYPKYPDHALDHYDTEELKEQIAIFETERNVLAKNANLGAIAEYRKKEADYMARVAELDEVTEQRNKVRREHEELRRRRLEMFMDGFSQITLKLKEMYQMITLGGDAELELVDSLDPFSEGIVFSVRPPKKSWKNISNLSGGEKTLSSLALVFALHHYKPTPLYVMDEIDAALDYKNVSIVANYIKDRTKDAQFIIISLRNNMFELCDRMVGVYKTNNKSKSLPTNPAAYGVLAQQDGRSMTPALRNRTNAAADVNEAPSHSFPKLPSLSISRPHVASLNT